MKIEIKIEREIILKITEKEAKWLKNLAQNYLGGDPNDEKEEDKAIRKRFWDNLSDMGEY